MRVADITHIPMGRDFLYLVAKILRAKPVGEHLAIHARQLDLKPNLQVLRGHFGPLLFHLTSSPPLLSSQACERGQHRNQQEFRTRRVIAASFIVGRPVLGHPGDFVLLAW
jgi:hypothetical protein